MNVKKLQIVLVLLISALTFNGCIFSDLDRVDVVKEEKQKIKLELEDPEQIKTRKVQWYVITPENKDDVFKELSEKRIDPVLFGLTDFGYENLSLNISEIRNYILQQKNIIIEYKNYYEGDK